MVALSKIQKDINYHYETIYSLRQLGSRIRRANPIATQEEDREAIEVDDDHVDDGNDDDGDDIITVVIQFNTQK